MKKIALILIFIHSMAMAQTHRFIYEYKFAPDSTRLSDIKKEMMALDIHEKGSKYESLVALQQDSIRRAEVKKMVSSGSMNFNFNFNNNQRALVNYRVTKELPEPKVFLHQSLSGDRYQVLEEEKMNWTISNEEDKIGPYTVQKATTKFGGRHWTAWFTTDLPFQDGPYKFHGLPGLIVKIQDQTGTHEMNLVGNTIFKTEEKIANEDALPRRMGFERKEIKIDENQFKKVWKEYVEDPTKGMRQRFSAMGGDGQHRIMKVRTPEGREISDPREMEQSMKERLLKNIKENNNRIELSLYR